VFPQQQKNQKDTSTLLIMTKKQSEGKNIHKQLIIFSDGGARGNPGPAAIAFTIQSESGHVLTTSSRYIGLHTNNQAEYEALIAALESAAKLQAEEVVCHLDSELVTKQLNGEYAVKNQELRQSWLRVQELKRHFKQVRFINVSRGHSQIQKVDKLVNATLDAEGK
jgi:ribonuclease HI